LQNQLFKQLNEQKVKMNRKEKNPAFKPDFVAYS